MSQLGRLGRRAAPLLQQLERCAPGAVQQFSSAAEAPAGGMGRGAAAGPGSSPGAPGRGPRGDGGRGRGGPRPERQGGRPWQRGGEGGGGGGRQPGRMSELLPSDRRPPQREGGGGPPADRRPRPYGGPRPWAAGGGGGGEPFVADEPLVVPRELEDEPYEIITQFEYLLRDAANPDAPAVDVQDVVTDVADIANMNNLALLKYYVTPRELQDFLSGSMSTEEQNELADKLAQVLLADDRYVQKRATVKAAIEADPDYDLAASLGSRPKLRGSARSPPPAAAEVAAALDSQKAALMAQYDMSEEEWEAARAATIEGEVAEGRQAAAPVLPNHIARAARLMALLDQALPRDHPNYQAAKQRLEVLQGNPGWSHERKMVFAKRLIKRLSSTAR